MAVLSNFTLPTTHCVYPLRHRINRNDRIRTCDLRIPPGSPPLFQAELRSEMISRYRSRPSDDQYEACLSSQTAERNPCDICLPEGEQAPGNRNDRIRTCISATVCILLSLLSYVPKAGYSQRALRYCL